MFEIFIKHQFNRVSFATFNNGINRTILFFFFSFSSLKTEPELGLRKLNYYVWIKPVRFNETESRTKIKEVKPLT